MGMIEEEIKLAMERSEIRQLAEKLFNVFQKKHRELFSQWFKDNSDYDSLNLPAWDKLSENMKECWKEVARTLINNKL